MTNDRWLLTTDKLTWEYSFLQSLDHFGLDELLKLLDAILYPSSQLLRENIDFGKMEFVDVLAQGDNLLLRKRLSIFLGSPAFIQQPEIAIVFVMEIQKCFANEILHRVQEKGSLRIASEQTLMAHFRPICSKV